VRRDIGGAVIRTILAASCGLFLISQSLAALATDAVSRFAIVIGNNRAEHARTESLRYADDDALAMHRLLAEAGVNSRLLVTLDADTRLAAPDGNPNGPARAADLRREARELQAVMREAATRGPVEFLFFFSGHGDVEGGEGYLVLEDSRFSRTELYQLLADSPASTNHVFVDACRSYFIANRSAGGRREPYAGAFPIERVPAELSNTGFVLSTSSDRESHEWERYQAGILSHELRSALRGAADADLDGHISYRELAAFLHVANASIPNARFRPDFLVQTPRDAPLKDILSWPPRPAPLSIGAEGFGHFYIESARGERLLDAHPALGQRLRLWLPRQRPLFVRSDDGSAESTIFSLDPVSLSGLEPAPREVATKGGALSLAFAQLFALPFGERNVQDSPIVLAGAQERNAPLAVDAPVPFALPRFVVGGLAVAGAGAGLTLNAMAIGSHLDAGGASQTRIDRLNHRIRALNLASLACYAVASAAGLTWTWLKFWPPRDPVTFGAAVVPDEVARGLELNIEASF
jgi:hypothetical protein